MAEGEPSSSDGGHMGVAAGRDWASRMAKAGGISEGVAMSCCVAATSTAGGVVGPELDGSGPSLLETPLTPRLDSARSSETAAAMSRMMVCMSPSNDAFASFCA